MQPRRLFGNRQTLKMNVGDIIQISNAHMEKSYLWKGYKWGRNINTTKSGYFPAYKTKKRHKIVDFPAEKINFVRSSRQNYLDQDKYF